MHWFSDTEFKKIQNEIVIGCVDTLVMDENDRVLLGYRVKQPLKDWWVFGGRMSVGEEYRDTARRTLAKELNISKFQQKGVLGPYLLKYNDLEEGKLGHLLMVPIVKIKTSDFDIDKTSKADHCEIKWFTAKEIAETTIHPYLRLILQDAGLLNHVTDRITVA